MTDGEIRKGRTFNTEPTLTDQSQAHETDINVIVGKFGIGTVPGNSKTPIYGDFSELPADFRDWIETARSLEDARKALPPQLRDMPIQDVLALTPEQIAAKLKPAEQPAEQPKGEPK